MPHVMTHVAPFPSLSCADCCRR